MTTGTISTRQLNISSQQADLTPFQTEGDRSFRKKYKNRHMKQNTKTLEHSIVGIGAFSLVALLALWKKGHDSPENGLLRSINAQSIPILSNLRLPKSGRSLVDTTSTWMTTINSAARIFFAMLTHQHLFETVGLEVSTRLSTISLIDAVKGRKNKETGQESVLSINRWFLNYMMKPKHLTRKIDTSLKESAWVQFNSNWRNTVGSSIQEMFGLNTPFEIMFPSLKEPPAIAGTMMDIDIDAFRKRLTLENLETDIHNSLRKGVEIKKAYTEAQKAFDLALSNPQDAPTLTAAYEQLASAQYDYNHCFHDIRYQNSAEGLKDHWLGRQSRENYEAIFQKIAGRTPDQNLLSRRTLDLWKKLDAKNEQKNGIQAIQNHSDEVDWEKQLTRIGKLEAQKSIQALRDDLKAGPLFKPLTNSLDKVLLLEDGTPGIPEDAPRRLMDIFIPYLQEATKYYRYEPAFLKKVEALQKTQPTIPTPVNLYDLSDEGFEMLFKGLVDDLDSLNPPSPLLRPREEALRKGFKLNTEEPLSNEKKLALFKEKAHQRISNYLDLKEEQNLVLNNFSLEATRVYEDVIQDSVHDYLNAEAKTPQALKFDYYLAQHLGKARAVDHSPQKPQDPESPPSLFTGKAFNLLDAGFKLNERIRDIDQYKQNSLIKSAIQVGFQTAVTAFILSNVLFFIVYNSFSRLDADYKGRGKIPLNDWVTSIKGLFGQNAPKEKEKTPLEAKVNVSIHLGDKAFKSENTRSYKNRHRKPPPMTGGTST